MMGTPEKPFSSSVSRMASTRPSIMSEGATMSAPARTCDNAACESRSRVGSFWISPPLCTRPQWPWEVYSHRHTSVMTTSSGKACLSLRTASCTMPSSA